MPANLLELLEAPVPILVGLPAIPGFQPSFYPDVIWVKLDQTTKGSRLECKNKAILQSVKEPSADGLKGKLTPYMKTLASCKNIFQLDPQNGDTLAAAQLVTSFWKQLAGCIPSRPSLTSGEVFLDTEELKRVMLGRVQRGDAQFVAGFVGTQVFLSYVEAKMQGSAR